MLKLSCLKYLYMRMPVMSDDSNSVPLMAVIVQHQHV